MVYQMNKLSAHAYLLHKEISATLPLSMRVYVILPFGLIAAGCTTELHPVFSSSHTLSAAHTEKTGQPWQVSLNEQEKEQSELLQCACE